jgi:DNA polymerase V
MNKKWIGVLDCNNFFVSCERIFRPDLMGKPVIVLSSNDGCVVARSQEVKDIGVLMGVPYFQIKDIVKKAKITVFSSNFALYRDVSRRVFAVMREVLGEVEQYSIDEAFFQINSEPEEVAWRVKNTVEKQVGIPVSVGISRTKTQAKYASKQAKKSSGVSVLDDPSWLELVTKIPLSQIWGVGGKIELQYKKHKIFTVGDLLRADSGRIAQVFGVGGLRLQQELKGESVLKLDNKVSMQKSIVKSRSFARETNDFKVLSDAVAYHLRHAMVDLRKIGMKTSVLSVSLGTSRHGDFLLQGGEKKAVLPMPSDNTIELMVMVNNLLVGLYKKGVPYKKVGIKLAGFIPVTNNQFSLFDSVNSNKSQSLMSVIDCLNNQKGKEVILLGSRLCSDKWHSREGMCSPAYTTRWSDLVSVKAK